MTKTTTDRTAKFYGTCQICAHEQKLPNGRLSLHGYSVQWNCFVGTCPGSKHLPFEQEKTLAEREIENARNSADNLRKRAALVRADRKPTNIEMSVSAYEVRNEAGEKLDSYGLGALVGARKGYASSAEVRGDLHKVGDAIEFRFTLRDKKFVVVLGLSSWLRVSAKTSVSEIVAKLKAREADAMLAHAKNFDNYADWQAERCRNWKPVDLKPVPESEQGAGAATVHAIGEYWTKREGRPIALCVSSSRASAGKQTTPDRAKVTCKVCLKALAAMDADALESKAADALIAEMVAKHGPRATERFSDANKNAIKEIRYARKDVDKNIRKRATDRLERYAS